VLAVDGGNSKTDVVLLDAAGGVVGASRAGGSSHEALGLEGSVAALEGAVLAAGAAAGLDPGRAPIARLGMYCLAGADLPVDDRRIGRALAARGWTQRVVVRNDTFAILRAGTDRGWGVAVACGAGLNCAGAAPDGRIVRFPALGELSGDRAHGGGWLGRAALGSALRARDGRGPRTALERLVPAHFGLRGPSAVLTAVHVGRLHEDRLLELAPIVFGAAENGDAVSRSLIDELADEVVAMAGSAIRRLRLSARDVDVVLGGGLFRNGDPYLLERIGKGIASVAPAAVVSTLHEAPVVGAALLGLDGIGATGPAKARARAVLSAG
jgi:N-acetylglucosamine kinase-like BadF-type ATPase